MPHFQTHDSGRLGSRKMAIPRLAEGSETAFSSPGRFHRRHVRRACESCRQRKTKCTGDKSGCRNCREAGIICCYTDGKREKSKRQLASLSAKVQAYEDVIRKLSNRFGVSDEQLMNIALAEGTHHLELHNDAYSAASTERKSSWSSSDTEPSLSRSPSIGSFEVDHTEEDFNRDETARATGFIGKGSEINWLQKIKKEVDQECEPCSINAPSLPDHEPCSPSSAPRMEGQHDSSVASFNYYLDDLDMRSSVQLDPYEVPTRETATKLFNIYLNAVHPSFPIIGISTFVSQFQVFFNQPSLKPGKRWLAILNLIFAVGAKYSQLTDTEPQQDSDEHLKYFSRARVLSLEDQTFQHPDLQQLQVEGLASFYLLALGHVNRSWKLIGSAVRGALCLGLHLRNVGSCTSDISKEIRYRVWWSLYTIEHLLTVMTGRPSCITDNSCTTPLPVPFDESDFQKKDVARLISSPLRGNPSQPERISVCSGTPGMTASLDSDSNEVPSGTKDAEMGKAEYLKSLPPCMSLYFLQLASLTSISKRMTVKLYSPEAAQSPWATTEFTIQSLMLDIDSWLMNLPPAYDFTSAQTSQCPASQRMGLALFFYSTKIGITRPCLCRLDSSGLQSDKTYEFCNNAAAECVESACHMLTLFPDTPDGALLHKVSPWWCILHFLMQATTVLLLELAFKVQHVPDKEPMISKAVKKAIEWLFALSKANPASERAWRLCDGFLRRLAPGVGIDVGDIPRGDDSTPNAQIEVPFDLPPSPTAAVQAAAASTEAIGIDLDSIAYSPMDRSSTPLAMPLSYGVDPSDTLEFLKSGKSLDVRNPYDEYLPYDAAAGQITGSFFPTTNIDFDLGGYLWCDPIY